MKRLITLLVAVVACTPAWGMNLTEWSWNQGSFEAFGEALYFRPSATDLGFIIDDPTYGIRTGMLQPIGKQKGNCIDYDWGFRLGLGYVVDCGWHDFEVYYSRLRTSDNLCCSPKDGAAFWLTFGNPGADIVAIQSSSGCNALACQAVNAQWDAVDVELGTRSESESGLERRYHFGLHWTELQLARTVTADGYAPLAQSDVTYTASGCAHAWGIGPRIGFDGRYPVACGFGLGLKGGIGVLLGESSYHAFSTSNVLMDSAWPPVETDQHYRHDCRLFPEIDLAASASYRHSCGCVELTVDLGWEFRSYINAIESTWFYTGAPGRFSDSDSFNLTGLYLRLLAAF